MWIWREDREDTGGGAFDRHDRSAGGWRLDTYGSWTWSERGLGGLADDRADFPAASPADETPIFHAVSDDHSRRARLHPVEGEAAWAAIPEPGPGSGPLPIQYPSDDRPGSGHLASVPTVPPPVGPYDDVAAASPEDEVRRRAERRRRPRAVRSGADEARGSGRHALRGQEPRGGRHALGG